MHAGVVDVCLVPEVDFDVPALMAHARLLLAQKSHIVVRAHAPAVCSSSAARCSSLMGARMPADVQGAAAQLVVHRTTYA